MDENSKGKTPRVRPKSSDTPRLVGDCENLLPYAWNNPMVIDEHKCSKVLREMSKAEKLRLSPEGEMPKKA